MCVCVAIEVSGGEDGTRGLGSRNVCQLQCSGLHYTLYQNGQDLGLSESAGELLPGREKNKNKKVG